MEAVGHRTKSWIQGGGYYRLLSIKTAGNGPFCAKIHDYSVEKYLCAIKFRDSDQYYGFGQANWDQFMWIHMAAGSRGHVLKREIMPQTHDQIVEKNSDVCRCILFDFT